MDVAEGNVAHVARAGVRLDPGGVARVDGRDVLEDDVLDVVGLPGIGPNAADCHGPGLVADDVADVDVAAVAFDADAILRSQYGQLGGDSGTPQGLDSHRHT